MFDAAVQCCASQGLVSSFSTLIKKPAVAPAIQLRSVVTQLTTDKSAINYITSTDLLVDNSSAIAS